MNVISKYFLLQSMEILFQTLSSNIYTQQITCLASEFLSLQIILKDHPANYLSNFLFFPHKD